VGVSAPGTPVPGDINGLMTFGQSVKGIIEGDSDPDEFIPELIEHFKAGRLPFDKLVKTYPLSEINSAIEAQHRGDCVKAVLIP
jgi:aryl-alcohol dehydrogenase